MQSRAVVTLHGLGRTCNSMNAIGRHLEQGGEYTWINVWHASTRNTIDEHAQSLARVLDSLEGVNEIHFVCHSLGNLVVRIFWAKINQELRWKIDPRIRRMVMLRRRTTGPKLLASRLTF